MKEVDGSAIARWLREGGKSGEGVLALVDNSGEGGSTVAFFFVKVEGRRLAFVGRELGFSGWEMKVDYCKRKGWGSRWFFWQWASERLLGSGEEKLMVFRVFFYGLGLFFSSP